MITDSQLAFIPNGGNQSMVAGAGVSIPSVNTLDLLGQGVGTPPANIIGAVTNWGTDFGVGGRRRPELEMAVGTAFATGNAATLNVAMQAAPDPGAGGNWTPTTWTTIVETGAIAAASLTAGQTLLRAPILPAFPANLRPRFLRLLFQIPAATNFSAGTIAFALFTWVRDDLAFKFTPRNYQVV
jgi:hypothetical protein